MDHSIANVTLIECANSAHCAPAKHHYDECVERVTQQQEDEDYKGPKEDCVEECEYSQSLPEFRSSATQPGLPLRHILIKIDSLPPRPLRDPVRRPQAVAHPEINESISSTGLIPPPLPILPNMIVAPHEANDKPDPMNERKKI